MIFPIFRTLFYHRDHFMNQPPPLTSHILLLLFCIITVLSRVIPHPGNVTPFLALIILCNQRHPQKTTLLCSMLVLFMSDCLLALWQPHSLFGSWTVFTYSGWIMIAWLTQKITQNTGFSLTWVGVASISFWVWTNFGTWLCGTLYNKTLVGLITCYSFALPFLERSLTGDLLWFSLLSAALHGYQRYHSLTIYR